eukprot:jgi/Phyca11/4399/fgenesh1_pm.PHYCAscaffold_1_\
MIAMPLDSDDDGDDSLRSYEPIDVLQDAGISTADIAKLKNDGFATIGQLFQVSQKKLLGVKGISEAKVNKLLQAGKKIMPEKNGFVSASTLYQQSQNKLFITTGSQQFDRILGGGIETMSVTEVHGEFRTGKTQLCHTLAHSHDAQMDLVIELGALFADPDQGPFCLLIIDSVTALFRTDFSGIGELSERQQRLNQHLVRLVRHAEEFNIAVLVVNQVMADPGANATCGHVMSHGVHTRALMKKGRAENRICKIIDSPCMPEAECSIQLCTGGIADSDE